ncbi:MAG TPA: hypothetical protein VIK53_15505 [Verrucomicrobiae bacterium]
MPASGEDTARAFYVRLLGQREIPKPESIRARGDRLHGVMVIKGQWAGGSPLLAISNFARNNRNSIGVGSMVWIKNQPANKLEGARTTDAASF